MNRGIMQDATRGAGWLAETVGVRTLGDRVLEVRGADAATWLNGQITNQILTAHPGDAVYALVLDARGKILSDVWVLLASHLLLVTPQATRDALVEHFDRYIVMEDVELEPSDARVVTVQGPRAREVVERAGLSGFPCDRLGYGGLDVLSGPDPGAVEERLVESAESLGGGVVDEPGWELARLRSARPRFGLDFGHAHYPQEAGLTERAVSFLKGCYLGQEVVCTLQNRGQLSRRLVALGGGPEAVEAGAELSVEGKTVGQVTSVVRDGGGIRALGYVKRGVAAAGARVAAPGGTLSVELVVGEARADG